LSESAQGTGPTRRKRGGWFDKRLKRSGKFLVKSSRSAANWGQNIKHPLKARGNYVFHELSTAQDLGTAVIHWFSGSKKELERAIE
jgi:hypothetical protein